MAGGDEDEGVYAASVPMATGQGDLLACRECGLVKTPVQVRSPIAAHTVLLSGPLSRVVVMSCLVYGMAVPGSACDVPAVTLRLVPISHPLVSRMRYPSRLYIVHVSTSGVAPPHVKALCFESDHPPARRTPLRGLLPSCGI